MRPGRRGGQLYFSETLIADRSIAGHRLHDEKGATRQAELWSSAPHKWLAETPHLSMTLPFWVNRTAHRERAHDVASGVRS